MKQVDLGLDLSAKRTRKREFLDEMERVVPWSKLTALVEPHHGTDNGPLLRHLAFGVVALLLSGLSINRSAGSRPAS